MKTVNVAGGNLFQIAFQQYSDATQWNRIALANNMIDPFFTGFTTLIIPALDTNASGGVYYQ